MSPLSSDSIFPSQTSPLRVSVHQGSSKLRKLGSRLPPGLQASWGGDAALPRLGGAKVGGRQVRLRKLAASQRLLSQDSSV